MDQFLTNHVENRIRASDPILQVGHTYQHEGTRRYIQDPDGTKRYFDYRPSHSSFSVPRADYRTMDVPQLMDMLEAMIRDQAAQMARRAYEKLSNITEQTGNVVDAGGAPYSFELDFKMLEKIDLEFEDDPMKPILPTPIASPEIAAIHQERRAAWFADEANQKRFVELLKQKHEQWRAREDRRTLVD